MHLHTVGQQAGHQLGDQVAVRLLGDEGVEDDAVGAPVAVEDDVGAVVVGGGDVTAPAVSTARLPMTRATSAWTRRSSASPRSTPARSASARRRSSRSAWRQRCRRPARSSTQTARHGWCPLPARPHSAGMCERMSASIAALSSAACGTGVAVGLRQQQRVTCTVWYGSDWWKTSHQPHPPSYICGATAAARRPRRWRPCPQPRAGRRRRTPRARRAGRDRYDPRRHRARGVVAVALDAGSTASVSACSAVEDVVTSSPPYSGITPSGASSGCTTDPLSTTP